MYELMVADWTADALANEGITGPSNLGNGGSYILIEYRLRLQVTPYSSIDTLVYTQDSNRSTLYHVVLIITGTPCQYYAAQGVVSGAGTIDLGDNGASISGDGRLVVLEPNPYVVLLE